MGIAVPVVCNNLQSGGHVLSSEEPDLLVALLNEVPHGLVQVEAQLLHAGPSASEAVVCIMLGLRKQQVFLLAFVSS